MSQYYDGSGRMRERTPDFWRSFKLASSIIAVIGLIVSYPLWGRLVPGKRHIRPSV